MKLKWLAPFFIILILAACGTQTFPVPTVYMPMPTNMHYTVIPSTPMPVATAAVNIDAVLIGNGFKFQKNVPYGKGGCYEDESLQMMVCYSRGWPTYFSIALNNKTSPVKQQARLEKVFGQIYGKATLKGLLLLLQDTIGPYEGNDRASHLGTYDGHKIDVEIERSSSYIGYVQITISP